MSEQVWLFGGLGYAHDPSPGYGYLNDLWLGTNMSRKGDALGKCKCTQAALYIRYVVYTTKPTYELYPPQ